MTNKPHIPVITIDGPSGAGKGTIARSLARQLHWRFLDSGALYRVLALAALQHAVVLDNAEALEVLAAHLDVRFNMYELGKPAKIILEGEDVTEAIRSESCGEAASKIAALPGVRHALIARQRAFREAPGLVADGRDMGTVIFPDADVKIYLDASVNERAKRRCLQLKEKGKNVSIGDVLAELHARDARDKGRLIAPLKPAADAVVIDTTTLQIEEVLERVVQLAQCIQVVKQS